MRTFYVAFCVVGAFCCFMSGLGLWLGRQPNILDGVAWALLGAYVLACALMDR